MSSFGITAKYIAIAKGLQIDYVENSDHTIITIPSTAKNNENDHISDITGSSDCKYLAMLTSISKQLILYDISVKEITESFILPRSASKIRFTTDNNKILVADKSGDVLIYGIAIKDTGTKLLGHLSLLLDVLQTNDEKYIITSDRDEKIKVSCYPNTYNIQTYCLGHKEFVNHIELLPHNERYLVSSSGDGTVKLWDFKIGQLCHDINTFIDINNDELKNKFVKIMDEEGVEVNTLPVVHLAAIKLNETSSILVLSVHTFNMLLVYSICNVNSKISHKLEEKIEMEHFPTDLKFHESTLYVYHDSVSTVTTYAMDNNNTQISFKHKNTIKVFQDTNTHSNKIENHLNNIKVLYKRKFDNVQEYQERKKLRLGKLSSSQ